MGARFARITPEEFLIPPEFHGYRLAERSAGQIGGLRLTLGQSAGLTRFRNCYQQVPLRTLPPFHYSDEPAGLVYMINPTAGLMDGDGHLVELDVEPGVHAVVTGQSSNRIHPAVKSFATQQWHVRVAPGARLVVLPGPNIPYHGSRYYQRALIDLEDDAQVVWGDVWTPGRYARNALSECYQFEEIVQELEVRRDGKLVFRDRFVWKGPWDSDRMQWMLGGDRLTGSAGVFVTGAAPLLPRPASDALVRAVLPTAHGDTLFRWCGPVPELITDVVTAAFQTAGSWSGDPAAQPWLLRSHNLVPNHWFSVRTPA